MQPFQAAYELAESQQAYFHEQDHHHQNHMKGGEHMVIV
jgi:hypothetical protein